MATTIVVITATGAGTWTCPAGVTAVQVECIGGGVGGTGANFFPPKGGGAGVYAKTNAAVVVPGTIYTLNVGAGYISPNGINQGYGDATWVGDANPLLPSCLCFADAGNAVNGGTTGASKGDVKYKGGDGGAPAISGTGPGGGGAGGPNGAGADGTATVGGAGDGGLVAGGTGGSAGASGTSMGGGTVGPGGGGAPASTGGAGGHYGAGGAGGTGGGVTGGNPGTGLIVLTYTSPPAPAAHVQGHVY